MAYRSTLTHTTKVVRRAAFDIGSGAMKLQVADIVLGSAALRTSTYIEKIVFGEEHPVMLGDDLNKSTDNTLSAEIRQIGLDTALQLAAKATELGCVQPMAGIATAVFRHARNGREYLDELQSKSGVRLQVVSQEEEARLGYHTACALVPSPNGAVVWDSGGGSFQITGEYGIHGAGTLSSFLGPFGASGVTRMCVEEVQSKDYVSGTSPNPMSLSDANNLIALIREKLSALRGTVNASGVFLPPRWISTTPIVLAIGGPNAIFCLASDVLDGQKEFSATHVRSAISRVVGYSDSELAARWCVKKRSDPPKFVVTKLCLLCAVMEHLQIQKVKVVPVIGCCAGVLVSEQYYLTVQ